MPPTDPFTITDKLDEALLQVIIARLETRARHAFFARMLDEYLDAMAIDQAHTVLDIGCGTGVAARAIARRPAFVGHISAIDLSPTLLTAAARFAAEEGVGQAITFLAGDTHSLNFPGGSFHAVIAHTLLSHVDDPLAVLKEVARVLRPGGMVAIFDGDYASLTFGHANAEQGKAYEETLVAAVVNNPRVMRQLPRFLRAAGLELVAAFPHLLAEIGQADFWVSAIDMFQGLVPRSGTMTAAEIDAWAAAQRQDSAEGIFFGASSFYSYIARRAPTPYPDPPPTHTHT